MAEQEMTVTKVLGAHSVALAQYDYTVTEFSLTLTTVAGIPGYEMRAGISKKDNDFQEVLKGFVSSSAVLQGVETGVDAVAEVASMLFYNILCIIQQRYEVEDLLSGRIKQVGEVRS